MYPVLHFSEHVAPGGSFSGHIAFPFNASGGRQWRSIPERAIQSFSALVAAEADSFSYRIKKRKNLQRSKFVLF